MVGIYTVKSGEIKTEDGESKRSQKSSHINKSLPSLPVKSGSTSACARLPIKW